MVFLFKNTNGPITWGAVSNIIPTPITILTATSTAAGQITLTWSGGIGQNAKYTYALSTGGLTVTSSDSFNSGTGVHTTTINFTPNTSITTNVTVTATVLGGSTSATYTGVTTLQTFPTPTMYLAKSTFTSSVPTIDTTGNYTISTTNTAPTMTLDGTRGYCWTLSATGTNNKNLGLYFNYTYKTAITVSYWMKWTNTNTIIDCFSLCDSAGDYKIFNQIWMGTGNPYQCGISGVTSGYNNINPCPAVGYSAGWFMVTNTWNGTAGTVYVNGTAYSSSSGSLGGASGILNSTGKILVGSLSIGGAGGGCDGLISSIYVWDQILTSTQINAVYANT